MKPKIKPKIEGYIKVGDRCKKCKTDHHNSVYTITHFSYDGKGDLFCKMCGHRVFRYQYKDYNKVKN